MIVPSVVNHGERKFLVSLLIAFQVLDNFVLSYLIILYHKVSISDNLLTTAFHIHRILICF